MNRERGGGASWVGRALNCVCTDCYAPGTARLARRPAHGTTAFQGRLRKKSSSSSTFFGDVRIGAFGRAGLGSKLSAGCVSRNVSPRIPSHNRGQVLTGAHAHAWATGHPALPTAHRSAVACCTDIAGACSGSSSCRLTCQHGDFSSLTGDILRHSIGTRTVVALGMVSGLNDNLLKNHEAIVVEMCGEMNVL